MRISTNNWFRAQSQSMLERLGQASEKQAQISTGLRLQTASDDPLAAQRADVLKRSLSETAQYQRNGDGLTSRLETSGQALQGMNDLMIRVRELALLASNDTFVESDRETVSVELSQLRDQLLGLANTRDADGSYVFAGANINTPAYATQADGSVSWQGSGDPIKIPMGPGNLISSGDSGAEFLGPVSEDGESVFDVMNTFIELMQPSATGSETFEERQARKTGMEAVLTSSIDYANAIGNVQASQGARLSGIETEIDRLDLLQVELENGRSRLEDVDITEAVIEMERLNTVLKAAQASFTRIAGLSLFSRL